MHWLHVQSDAEVQLVVSIDSFGIHIFIDGLSMLGE